MSIPLNDNLLWNSYIDNPNWHQAELEAVPTSNESQLKRAVNEVFIQTFKQTVVRGVQFIRDGARLVLKVPIRCIKTPFWKEENWKQLERAKVNAKLTGYAFVQLISVPAKFCVALAALITLAASLEKAKWLLDKSDSWTAHLDGRASQLEALKEVGLSDQTNTAQFNQYKQWLYSIDPIRCRRVS